MDDQPTPTPKANQNKPTNWQWEEVPGCDENTTAGLWVVGSDDEHFVYWRVMGKTYRLQVPPLAGVSCTKPTLPGTDQNEQGSNKSVACHSPGKKSLSIC